jgi:hypothetical protein
MSRLMISLLAGILLTTGLYSADLTTTFTLHDGELQQEPVFSPLF